MAVKIQVKVFWDVTMCRVMVRHQCFRGPHSLHLHFIRSSKMLVSYHNTAQLHIPEDYNLKNMY